MTERLQDGYYCCLRLFIADMKLIINNCRRFNERGTEYYKCSLQLEKFFIGRMKSAGLWLDLNAS